MLLTGRLRDKIDIYAETETENDYSELEKSYAFSFSARAEISFQGGAEKMAGNLNYADKILKFKVRYCGDGSRYNERQFIKYDGDYYNIRSIDKDHRTRKFIILTGERAPAGTIAIIT